MFTTPEKAQLARIAQDWRLTPATFAQKVSRGDWIPARHLRLISRKIAQAVSKGRGRIIISLPPRHGKSELVSVFSPGWILENFPKKRIILASYGADLSEGFGRRVRDMFEDPDNKDLLRTKINRGSRQVSMFYTERGGYMASVGTGGAITGRGADVLLIDDYIKEVKEALSPTYREYIWNWFITTAYTRLEPNGTCIIIATRWHTDDLIGRVLANIPGWDYIEIPAIAVKGDILERQIGEPLFPERYDLEALLDRRSTLGTVWFEALYQQKPTDQTKKLADKTWFGDPVPSLPAKALKMVRVWDLAATEGGGDYTTGTKEAFDAVTNTVYIADIKRDQVSPEGAELLVHKTAVEDGPDVPIGIEQEPGASGKALVSHYANNVLRGFKVKPIPVSGKAKTIRAQPFLAGSEAGLVKLVEGSWNSVFLKEFDSFPGGLNDDQVDTAAAAYSELTGRKVFSATFGRRAPSTTNFSSKAIRRAQFSMQSDHQARDEYGKVIPVHPHAKKLISGATFGRRESSGKRSDTDNAG